jgi:hypothetical protein
MYGGLETMRSKRRPSTGANRSPRKHLQLQPVEARVQPRVEHRAAAQVDRRGSRPELRGGEAEDAAARAQVERVAPAQPAAVARHHAAEQLRVAGGRRTPGKTTIRMLG